MTIVSTTVGKNTLEEMEKPYTRVQNAVLGCNLKNDRIISVRFQGKPFNITVTKSMPQPVMLKKLKLNSSMKAYKTF